MKNIIKIFAVLALVISVTACSKRTEYIIDANMNEEVFVPVSAMTMQLNNRNAGIVTSDAACDYYQYHDMDRVVLCRSDRTTGEVTVLAELPWVEDSNADVMFTDLYIKGEFLYFMAFDGNNGMPVTWCRVPVDGSSEYVKIKEMGMEYMGMMFGEDDIYVVYADFSSEGSVNTISIMEPETGKLTESFELSGDFRPLFFHDKYVYCMKYETTDGIFHTMIYRCSPSDASEPEQVWNYPENRIVECVADGEKLYISDIYGCRFYEAGLDGSNRTLLFEDVDIKGINVCNGTIYFILEENFSYDAGIYSYVPGSRMIFSVCKADDIVLGPLLTGTSGIWFTRTDGNFRLGQPAFVDACHDIQEAGV